MSMHMIKGVQVHGNSRKKKKALTENQLKKLELDWRQYNKSMRRSNCHDLQFLNFDDYVSYTRGEYKPKSKKEFTAYAPSQPNVRHTESYPSLKTSDAIPGSCAKIESQQYTGDYIVGIATMHKSNLVPVGRGADPKDFATMRRN